MSTNYPNSIDSLKNPTAGQPRNTPGVQEATVISNLNDAVEAIETYIGVSTEVNESTITGKIKKIDKLTTKGDIIYHDGTTTQRLPKGPNGYMLVSDTTDGVKYVPPASGGTVTNVSVTNANGFTGSVATPTTTPVVTIGTSITGLVKGNGTSISPATQGSDYYAPGGTDVSVSDGGTGLSSLTPFAPVFGGTTSTSPLQQTSVGTVGQVLTSNGAGSVPTMQSIPDQYTLLFSTTLGGLGSTINTGTLTQYNYYKIVYNVTSDNSTTFFEMQVNGQTGGSYSTISMYNTSISTSTGQPVFFVGQPSSGFGLAGELIVDAVNGSTKNIYGKGVSLNGNVMMGGVISNPTNINSFQFLKGGSGILNGSVKIYGKN